MDMIAEKIRVLWHVLVGVENNPLQLPYRLQAAAYRVKIVRWNYLFRGGNIIGNSAFFKMKVKGGGS